MSIYSDGKEIIKDIISLSKGISDMELKNKILELQTTFYELNDENRELRLKVHELENEKIRDDELTYRNGVYTRGDAIYCGACWDRDKILSRVRETGKSETSNTVMFACDVCNAWRYSDIPVKDN